MLQCAAVCCCVVSHLCCVLRVANSEENVLMVSQQPDCCSVLQCIAVCYSVLLCCKSGVLRVANSEKNVLMVSQQPDFGGCVELGHRAAHILTATHCNTLQHTATHCNTMWSSLSNVAPSKQA